MIALEKTVDPPLPVQLPRTFCREARQYHQALRVVALGLHGGYIKVLLLPGLDLSIFGSYCIIVWNSWGSLSSCSGNCTPESAAHEKLRWAVSHLQRCGTVGQ